MVDVLRKAVPAAVRRSYLAKFGLLLVGIVVGAAGIAGIFFIDISAAVTADTQENLEATTVDEAETIAEWIETQEQSARMLSSYQAVEEGDSERIPAVFESELDELPQETHGIHYIDFETHSVEHSTEEAVVGDRLEDLGIEVHVREGSTVIEIDIGDASVHSFDTTYSDTFEWNDENLVAFLSPVENDDNAAVMITVNVEERAEQFVQPVDGAETQVVDIEDGDVMFAEDGTAVLNEYSGGTESEALHEVESGVFDRDSDEAVVAHAPVPGSDWAVVTHAPQESAYALVADVRNSLLALIGVSLFGFLLIGMTVGRNTARSFEDLAEAAQTLSTGDTTASMPETDRIDEVGRAKRSFEEIQSYLRTATEQADAIADQRFEDPVLSEDVPGNLGRSLETMRADIQTSIENLEGITERLEQRADEIATAMGAAAEGDLTVRIDESAENESMQRIAVSFNEMLADLEETVLLIQQLGEQVDDVSREVEVGVDEIETASSGVSQSAEEISAATAEQYERFETVNDEMNNLSATVEEIASTSSEVADISERAADRADAASGRTSSILSQMSELEEETEQIASRINELDEEMERIGEIVDVIDGIADETDMLATNASIEAARAKGSSDGFAVVAEEIKSLAKETADSTQSVDELISDVQDVTAESVSEMEEMKQAVSETVETVEEGLEDIDEIAEHVAEANQGVQSINDATEEQASASEEVVAMVDEATDSSRRTNNEAEDVAAAAEEQTASIAQIATGAQSLSEHAEELNQELEQFHVLTEPSSGGTHQPIAADDD